MNPILTLDKQEIEKYLPYRIIGEVTRCSVWNTGTRKRLYADLFDRDDLEIVQSIIRSAQRWIVKGLPNECQLRISDVAIWKKLEALCIVI